jgi:sugar diacid utilization regulator
MCAGQCIQKCVTLVLGPEFYVHYVTFSAHMRIHRRVSNGLTSKRSTLLICGGMSMATSAREVLLSELGLDCTAGNVSSMQPHISLTESTRTADSVQTLYAILGRLVSTLSCSQPLVELLRSLATLTRQATLVDLCVVMLLDPDNGQMIMQTSFPDLREYEVKIVPLEVDLPLWEKLCDSKVPGQLPVLNIHEREQLNPLKNVQYETLTVVPLSAQNDCIGLINCYSSKCLDFSAEDQVLLSAIAVQASLAIQNRLLQDTLTQVNSIKTFFDDLLSGKSDVEESLRGRAGSLGCDLTTPHVMVMLATAQLLESNGQKGTSTDSEEDQVGAFGRSMKLTKRRIQGNYPGSLLDERENMLFCIVPLDRDITGGGLKSWLDDLVRQVESEQHVRISTGISSMCNDIADYRRGFAEAQEALQIGQCFNPQARSTHFHDLGIYRYLYAFACSNKLCDPYLEQIAAIARYDEGHKRSALLDTLELYLEHGSNIKDSSELLGVHRNTLAQRIERIQSLCTISIEQYYNRLPLLAAIKIHRLQKTERESPCDSSRG